MSNRDSDTVSNGSSPNCSSGRLHTASPHPDGRGYYRQRNDSGTTSPTEDVTRQRPASKSLSTATSPQTQLHHFVPPMYNHYQTRGYESPFEDDLNDLDKFLVKATGALLEKEPDWKLFKSQATNRIPDIISQYKFVQSMVKELVGFTPFRSSAYRIEEVGYFLDHCYFKSANDLQSHVLAALKSSTGGDPSVFAAVYAETLHLLQLYGEGGAHYEDPDVLKMCKDDSTPKNGDNVPKHLLRLLQQKDATWVENHPENGVSV